MKRPIEEERARLYDLDPKKNKRGRCAVRYCRNMKKPTSNICSRCNHRRRKLNDPVGYAFDFIKQNAKRRGKLFNISKDYFEQLCKESGYLEHKGRRSSALSLDRINPERGYEPGNVRVISLSDNCSRKYDDPEHDPNCPF